MHDEGIKSEIGSAFHPFLSIDRNCNEYEPSPSLNLPSPALIFHSVSHINFLPLCLLLHYDFKYLGRDEIGSLGACSVIEICNAEGRRPTDCVRGDVGAV